MTQSIHTSESGIVTSQKFWRKKTKKQTKLYNYSYSFTHSFFISNNGLLSLHTEPDAQQLSNSCRAGSKHLLDCETWIPLSKCWLHSKPRLPAAVYKTQSKPVRTKTWTRSHSTQRKLVIDSLRQGRRVNAWPLGKVLGTAPHGSHRGSCSSAQTHIIRSDYSMHAAFNSHILWR